MSDPAFDGLEELLSSKGSWSPPAVSDRITWGKHKGLTYLELAQREPAYARWAASTIGGLKGQLCAEALALALGVHA